MCRQNELNTMPPIIGFCDMFLKQISALEFSFVDSPGGTTHHHPDEFYIQIYVPMLVQVIAL